LQALHLDPALPVLLVFGGSKGARSINRALLEALPGLLPEMQVLHISGNLDWPEVEAARSALSTGEAAAWAERYHAFPYLHDEMGAALAAADLVVARAGASTLGEFPALGLPAILVPYPHAWRYQKVNADYLAWPW
jgi:UDP-N-acetylglucosamine--N-acetylmuramyl-(pentapeptide) pyrophosphoryl-undecaprenol N-acetylglucosamine transferase